MTRNRIGDVAETLLDYFDKRTTFLTEKVVTIPASSYFDPGQRTAEIDRIFKRVPLMVALSCELPKPGDYKAMDIVGTPLLVVRNGEGGVGAFLNVCAHRWAPVAPEGYGSCTRHVCRFHGWTYGLDGKLVGISDQEKFGEVDKSTHGLRELPCKEHNGMIFACLTSGGALNVEEYYGGLLEEYADAHLERWAFLGSRTVAGANWKLSVSNFLESYHFATLHKQTVGLELVSNLSHFDAFGPHLRIGLAQRCIKEKLRATPRDSWSQLEGQGFDIVRILFPNVTGYIASEAGVSLFTQTFPGTTPESSRTVLLFLRREPAHGDADRNRIENEISKVTNVADNEDHFVGREIQRGLASEAHKGLLYGRNERANQYFHEWISWYLEDGPGAPVPKL